MFEGLPSNETEFKQWLEKNASEALRGVGLREGQTVLDYGCGQGTFAVPAARIVGGDGKVCALDTDAEALAALRRRARDEGLENLETILVEKSAPALPLAPESLDVILLYDVLHLVEDRRALLTELRRALKSSGFLSVFPMHVGREEMLQLAGEGGTFALRDQLGLLLSFGACEGRDRAYHEQPKDQTGERYEDI